MLFIYLAAAAVTPKPGTWSIHCPSNSSAALEIWRISYATADQRNSDSRYEVPGTEISTGRGDIHRVLKLKYNVRTRWISPRPVDVSVPSTSYPPALQPAKTNLLTDSLMKLTCRDNQTPHDLDFGTQEKAESTLSF
ncbi:hypothetical protein RvY_17561 [Ramazzottius varieornatus]|uniref:Uncharacterized protein n=1 Tax=Ramazzottius varieornatus TaxID=947166 RepID=A0A1D1W2J5_RAMVA|nr:hypothetical protein RvY_17561 [Ramazzottius varieornatus]